MTNATHRSAAVLFETIVQRFEDLSGTRWARLGAALAFAGFIIVAEGDPASLPFTFLIGAFLVAIVYLFSARPAFALFIAASMLTLSTAVSMAKRKLLGMNAHVFDVWFYMSKGDTLHFLWDEFRTIVVAAGVALCLFVVLATIVFRRSEKVALAPIVASGTTFGFIAMSPFALPLEADNLSYHNRLYHRSSSFFVSFSDIPRLLAPSPLPVRAASRPSSPGVPTGRPG